MHVGRLQATPSSGFTTPAQTVDTLVERLRAREPSALRELFLRQQHRAFSLALRITADRLAAEDAVQEAFTQLWERAEQIEPNGGRLESLLMKIVHRRAIDSVRRRGRSEVGLPDPDLLQPIDDQATAMLERVEDALSYAGLQAGLKAALDALPPDQRAVIDLIYFQELSLREIADRNGLPLGTVKSRLRLAMSKLNGAIGSRTRP
jgi:RNA polymerase sigma-70 factor (ECF subfamily)